MRFNPYIALFSARAAIPLRRRWQNCNAVEIPQELRLVDLRFGVETIVPADCVLCSMLSRSEHFRATHAWRSASPGPLRSANLTFISRCVAVADCASWILLHELPHKHAGTAAGLTDPPGLRGAIEYGSHVPGHRAASLRFVADELLNFYCTVAVHDLGRIIHLFV